MGGSPVHQLGPAQGTPIEPSILYRRDISIGPRQPALETVDMKFVTLEQIYVSRLRSHLLLRGLIREDAVHIRLRDHLLLTIRYHNSLTDIHQLHANRARHILYFIVVSQELPVVKFGLLRDRLQRHSALNLMSYQFAPYRITDNSFAGVQNHTWAFINYVFHFVFGCCRHSRHNCPRPNLYLL